LGLIPVDSESKLNQFKFEPFQDIKIEKDFDKYTIFKVGRASGLTFGKIIAIGSFKLRQITFKNIFFIQSVEDSNSFLDYSDSGASLYAIKGKVKDVIEEEFSSNTAILPVGICFVKGNFGKAYAYSLKVVAEKLNNNMHILEVDYELIREYLKHNGENDSNTYDSFDDCDSYEGESEEERRN
jgi:hypothetical protein